MVITLRAMQGIQSKIMAKDEPDTREWCATQWWRREFEQRLEFLHNPRAGSRQDTGREKKIIFREAQPDKRNYLTSRINEINMINQRH